MVMPWDIISRNQALVEREVQTYGSGALRGTLAAIAGQHKLTKLRLPTPVGGGGEFEYQFSGKVASGTDLAKLVLEAEKRGFGADPMQLALMQQVIVSQGDDIVLRVYAVNLLPKPGHGGQPTINVTVAYITDPAVLNAALRPLVNKAVRQYR